ncbi:hypothetical protein FACS1894156_2220 [Bacteroidia bacterium]|nr:hypothetical protein FACS1894156_2220 [Bacteroidia bacterium]
MRKMAKQAGAQQRKQKQHSHTTPAKPTIPDDVGEYVDFKEVKT